MDIIHPPSEKSPFLVVAKPAGVPAAPLFEGDESVLTEAARLFPEIALVRGRKDVERGLVHRIDTETSGLVLIASTQQSYDALTCAQRAGEFEKWYRAEIERIPDCAERLGGFPAAPEEIGGDFAVRSAFRAFGRGGREVRPVTDGAGRAARRKGGRVVYETDISLGTGGVALCHLTAGFRHQVRCHLAWCGIPVAGDTIYNPDARADSERPAHSMRFTAFRISFPHPLTRIPLVFQM